MPTRLLRPLHPLLGPLIQSWQSWQSMRRHAQDLTPEARPRLSATGRQRLNERLSWIEGPEDQLLLSYGPAGFFVHLLRQERHLRAAPLDARDWSGWRDHGWTEDHLPLDLEGRQRCAQLSGGDGRSWRPTSGPVLPAGPLSDHPWLSRVEVASAQAAEALLSRFAAQARPGGEAQQQLRAAFAWRLSLGRHPHAGWLRAAHALKWSGATPNPPFSETPRRAG